MSESYVDGFVFPTSATESPDPLWLIKTKPVQSAMDAPIETVEISTALLREILRRVVIR